MMQRELTSVEISDLLYRNGEIQALVLQHNRLFEGKGTWDQVRMATYNLPIPTKGKRFTDSVFGDVVIFPDAKGNLHFSGNVQTNPGDINKPVFVSPSGNSIEQSLTDVISNLLKPAGQLIGAATALGIGYVGYKVLTHKE